ncbi:MAG: 3-hydroxy-5-phosphonooxypentane-2,4-dione thiolase [Euryarchaeota archaeon]|nr:3-hydroxy-5-phosphonooxypentane-2,4-dione thiolase [Euryarchaeota archaeon]
MDWGLKNRLNRIIRPGDGRTVMLAVDHGYFMGPTSGLDDFRKTINPLLPYADTVMLTRGALRNYIPPDCETPVVLRVSGGTSILSKELLREGSIVTMEDALRLNVAGVAFSILVGADFERDTLLEFTRWCDDCQKYGVPMVAVTAVGKEMVRDEKYMSLASRIAAELGAHIVKTYFVDGFERLVEKVPVPVVIAGGKKLPEPEALRMTAQALHAGAVGVDMGRNIFQAEDPVSMIKAVRAVVHEKHTPEEAFKLYNELRKKGH